VEIRRDISAITLRQTAQYVVWLAALGVILGLASAAREIAQQEYLSQGLRRTSLWILCDRSVIGALLGAAIGLIAVGWQALWRKALSVLHGISGLPSVPPRPELSGHAPLLRLAAFVAVCSALAALAIPPGAPTRPYLSYAFIVVTSFAVLWLVIMVLAAISLPNASDRERPRALFRLRWLAVTLLVYLVIALHVWAGPWTPHEKALLIGLSEFVDAFGANSLSLDVGLESVATMKAEADSLYLGQDYEAALAMLGRIMEEVRELGAEAVRIKNQALMWIFVIEWLVVTSTAIVCGLALWALMVRRRLYREVKMTRLARA